MELAYPHKYTGSKMTLPLLSKERFCHRSNWMWLHYKREGMMPLPDSGWIRALVLQLVTYWMSFPPEQQWAKGLLMIRLRDCAVWQLWHENTERASITRMESAKTAICLDRVGSCIKLFYTGWFMQDNMTLLWTVSLQQPSKRDTIAPPPPKKKTLQRFAPYMMPHIATFIYICHNR